MSSESLESMTVQLIGCFPLCEMPLSLHTVCCLPSPASRQALFAALHTVQSSRVSFSQWHAPVLSAVDVHHACMAMELVLGLTLNLVQYIFHIVPIYAVICEAIGTLFDFL